MSLQPLWEASWVVQTHVTLAMLALLIGSWLILRSRKGTAAHRSLGVIFLVLIVAAALLALFIPGRMPIANIGLGPIHLIVPFSLYGAWRAYSGARRGDIVAHLRWIRILYFGLLMLVLIMNALVFPGITQDVFFGDHSIERGAPLTDTIYKMGGRAAATAWLALVIGLFNARLRDSLFLYAGSVMPALLALVYLGLLTHIVITGPPEDASFNTVSDVKRLLCTDAGMTAAWQHFLAFDLFVGTWIARDGLGRRSSVFVLIPVLALTFLAGPIGYLAYLLPRWVRERRQIGSECA